MRTFILAGFRQLVFGFEKLSRKGRCFPMVLSASLKNQQLWHHCCKRRLRRVVIFLSSSDMKIAMNDIIISNVKPAANPVLARRLAREWSQMELAERAGISRAAVSAIEGERL